MRPEQEPGAYHGYVDGQLVKICPHDTATDTDPFTKLAHAQFRAMMLSEAYTCVGGASAVRQARYRFGVFPELASPEGVGECAASLRAFLEEFPEKENPVAVFVAVFRGPVIDGEDAFERLLWQHLQGLHDGDTQPPWWDPDDRDAWDDELGFVFSGRNFFVVGLHPAASRHSRVFAWPTLVFNTLSHMRPLEQAGQFQRMQSKIRVRDERLQGSPSPTLTLRQVAQFSGRSVGPDWEFPLRPREEQPDPE
ncbi:guanitoxin biosynthesis heme-dependent pre-guanitoxin N-hydroxylase GntA [Nonomuraea sp. NPDC059007]|uniref:guanitoxin biosynthesis heme-dependent pre-guanitoxin N-hydroxylase GntA n=1 Tax=Nonomuraea sp. NPDC059007 TaxID=3346692 RepID=UPI00368D88A5